MVGRLAVRPGQKQGHLRSSSESLFSSPRQCRRFETTDAAARIWEKIRATQIGRDRPRQTVIVQSGVYISVIRGRNGRIKRLYEAEMGKISPFLPSCPPITPPSYRHFAAMANGYDV